MNACRPDVSVVVPAFNRSQFLPRAVRSCLDPPCPVEVIVVDDGSTEDIAAVLASGFGRDPRIRLLRQENQGACAARNAGLAAAGGEYVKFLDSDDELLPAALVREVDAARKSGCDALLSGWEERFWNTEGREDPSRRRARPAPRLDRGIDDMLDGKGPCLFAALYRRSFIAPLRWDSRWTKAQDWGWALTVCLAGARFASLDLPCGLYHHHPGERVSSAGDRVLRSTRARQLLLRMVEEELLRQRALTDSRKAQLAQYYYRDAQFLARHDPAEWRRLWAHCQDLHPGFVPREPNRILRFLSRLLGVETGVRAYVMLKRLLDDGSPEAVRQTPPAAGRVLPR